MEEEIPRQHREKEVMENKAMAREDESRNAMRYNGFFSLSNPNASIGHETPMTTASVQEPIRTLMNILINALGQALADPIQGFVRSFKTGVDAAPNLGGVLCRKVRNFPAHPRNPFPE